MIEWIVPTVVMVVVPVTGYAVARVNSLNARLVKTEKDQEVHEKADLLQFASIAATLLDIRNEQRTQSTDIRNEQRDQSNKLDRLIEQTLHDAQESARLNASEVRRAAVVALEVVETARASALQVVAEAARLAKPRT